MARYTWDGDRSTYPVLVEGRTYRQRQGGTIEIIARKADADMAARGACSYTCRDDDGEFAQNDFAVLNKIVIEPGNQLSLLG